MTEAILMEKGWLNVLKDEFSAPYMQKLREFLIQEKAAGKIIYPPEELIFNAFCQTPFEEVKVVIIGQDPYHGKGQAHGLCFSVPKGIKTPPSLQNIFKELMEDLGLQMPSSGDLTPWAKQGILLLNATLTVREGEPLSHYGQGWEQFTDAVVEKVAKRNDPIAFMLWGKSAQEKVLKVFAKIPNHPHLILQAAHPSFYSASGFFGCKHFSKTNQFLIKNGKKPIDWQIV
jgi:uracil-DNA glycosylase